MTCMFILENDRVRVLEADFRINDKAIKHNHRHYAVHVLRGGKLKLKLAPEGKTDVLDLKTGQTILLQAQSHEATKIGSSELDLLVVELKK